MSPTRVLQYFASCAVLHSGIASKPFRVCEQTEVAKEISHNNYIPECQKWQKIFFKNNLSFPSISGLVSLLCAICRVTQVSVYHDTKGPYTTPYKGCLRHSVKDVCSTEFDLYTLRLPIQSAQSSTASISLDKILIGNINPCAVCSIQTTTHHKVYCP